MEDIGFKANNAEANETQESQVSVQPEKKKGFASIASLAGQIFAAAWVAVWSGVKFAQDLQAASIQDFIFSGFAIAGCFSPVFVNMAMDKIKDMKLCGTSY